jgi:hypothetical protein
MAITTEKGRKGYRDRGASGEGGSKWACGSSAMDRPVNTTSTGKNPTKSNQPGTPSVSQERCFFLHNNESRSYTMNREAKDETVSERVDHCVTISRAVCVCVCGVESGGSYKIQRKRQRSERSGNSRRPPCPPTASVPKYAPPSPHLPPPLRHQTTTSLSLLFLLGPLYLQTYHIWKHSRHSDTGRTRDSPLA